MRRPARGGLGCALALLLLLACAPAGLAQAAGAPANDAFGSAQEIHSLPATVSGTLVGATVETQEEGSGCAGTSEHTVWYAFRAPAAERVALNLAAGGALDAGVDVFHAIRSELQRLQCQRTDSEGHVALTFNASRNGLYYIRVASLPASQLSSFTLELFLPTPAVSPPGPRLPASGVSGQVDRIQNINAAYSVVMHTGVSYLISLADRTSHACVTAELFGPGTSSFEGASPLRTVHCGGYALFTPGAGEGGLYSIQVTPSTSFKSIQRFHLAVGAAGQAETAPGIELGNDAPTRGYLDSSSTHVLRLYRMHIASHSNLTLRLQAPAGASFNLQLRNEVGQPIGCECGSSGSVTLDRQLEPGRYYAVVSVHGDTSGDYTLIRESRTITSSKVSFAGHRASAGQGVGIDFTVSPAVSGRVEAEVERLDPVFGWQFYAQESGYAAGGSAQLPFTVPSVGHWRVRGRFDGSRTSSPSGAGVSYLLVTQ